MTTSLLLKKGSAKSFSQAFWGDFLTIHFDWHPIHHKDHNNIYLPSQSVLWLLRQWTYAIEHRYCFIYLFTVLSVKEKFTPNVLRIKNVSRHSSIVTHALPPTILLALINLVEFAIKKHKHGKCDAKYMFIQIEKYQISSSCAMAALTTPIFSACVRALSESNTTHPHSISISISIAWCAPILSF